MSHKRRLYQEALHLSRDEWHDYNVHADAPVRRICVYSSRSTTRPWRQTSMGVHFFRLELIFSGMCKTAYSPLFKKRYWRETGLEVWQAIQDTPALPQTRGPCSRLLTVLTRRPPTKRRACVVTVDNYLKKCLDFDPSAVGPFSSITVHQTNVCQCCPLSKNIKLVTGRT